MGGLTVALVIALPVVVVVGGDVGMVVGMGVGVVGVGVVVTVVASWWSWWWLRCRSGRVGRCVVVVVVVGVGVNRGRGWERGWWWWWWLRLRSVDRRVACQDMVRLARDRSTIYIYIMGLNCCGRLEDPRKPTKMYHPGSGEIFEI